MILKSSLLGPATAVAFFVLPTAVLARLKNDFQSSGYVPDVIPCLQKADDASASVCDGNTVPEMNTCLCSNGGDFVTNLAKCIGSTNPDLLTTTYGTLDYNCGNSETPVNMSKDDFVSIGQKAAATSTPSSSSSSTSSATSTGTQATNTSDVPSPSGGGLSQGAIIGIGVGAGVLVLALIGVAIFLFLRRRKQNNPESHPMLGSNNGPFAANSYQPSPLTGGGRSSAVPTTTTTSGYYGPEDFNQMGAIGTEQKSHPVSPVWRPGTQSPGLAPPMQQTAALGIHQPYSDHPGHNPHLSWNSQVSQVSGQHPQSWGNSPLNYNGYTAYQPQPGETVAQTPVAELGGSGLPPPQHLQQPPAGSAAPAPLRVGQPQATPVEMPGSEVSRR